MSMFRSCRNEEQRAERWADEDYRWSLICQVRTAIVDEIKAHDASNWEAARELPTGLFGTKRQLVKIAVHGYEVMYLDPQGNLYTLWEVDDYVISRTAKRHRLTKLSIDTLEAIRADLGFLEWADQVHDSS